MKGASIPVYGDHVHLIGERICLEKRRKLTSVFIARLHASIK